MGRRRAAPDLTSSNPAHRAAAERMSINMPVQGTAADIMKIAMIRAEQRLRELELPAALILQVHDELVLEVSEEAVAETSLRFAKRWKPPTRSTCRCSLRFLSDQTGTKWKITSRNLLPGRCDFLGNREPGHVELRSRSYVLLYERFGVPIHVCQHITIAARNAGTHSISFRSLPMIR